MALVEIAVDPVIPAPVDESYPALGRRAGLIDQQRRESGGLTDDDPGDPVIDKHPFRPRGG